MVVMNGPRRRRRLVHVGCGGQGSPAPCAAKSRRERIGDSSRGRVTSPVRGWKAAASCIEVFQSFCHDRMTHVRMVTASCRCCRVVLWADTAVAKLHNRTTLLVIRLVLVSICSLWCELCAKLGKPCSIPSSSDVDHFNSLALPTRIRLPLRLSRNWPLLSESTYTLHDVRLSLTVPPSSSCNLS